VITILTGDKKWEWDDKNDDKLEPSGIYTKNEFKNLLNDFRSDTPEEFRELFKICVHFNRSKREIFAWVSHDLNFLHFISKLGINTYYQVIALLFR
jgi:hypothetical protein